MKNKLWKQWMLSGVLVSAMVVSCGVSVSVQAEETTETEEAAETDSSAESEDDLRILFDQAVEDAMIAEDGEILPVVSLDEGEPYAVYNEEGRAVSYTHLYFFSFFFLSLCHQCTDLFGNFISLCTKMRIRDSSKSLSAFLKQTNCCFVIQFSHGFNGFISATDQ